MMRTSRPTAPRSAPSMPFALAAMLAAACAELPPEERLEQIRSEYSVTLTSFKIVDEPLGEEPAMAEGEVTGDPAQAGADAADADAAEAGDPGETTGDDPAAATVPMRTDVVLDLLVSTEAREPLDGLTVEFEQVDAQQQPKDRRLLWIDTSDLIRGPGVQITHVVEDISYQDGDGFSVQVVSPVSPEERDQYREFADFGG